MADDPDDPIKPLDREALFALVEAKTPWKRAAFQRLMGGTFGEEASAPLSQKLLARDLIGLPRDMQNKLRELQMAFPTATVTYVGPAQPLPKIEDKPIAQVIPFRRAS